MVKKRKSAVPDRAPSSAKRRQSASHPRAASRRVSSVATDARDEPSTPPQTPTPTPTLDDPTELPLLIPTKIAGDVPLPTVKESQLSLLPPPATAAADEYQTYSQSGVLDTALQRSRLRWLQDPPFEKYWAKPSKKKNQPQPASKNPPRDSMIKLGSCSFVVGPHHFQVMLYTVRDHPLPKAFPQSPAATQRSSPAANRSVSTPEPVKHQPRPMLVPSTASQQDLRHVPSTPGILPSHSRIAPSPTPLQPSVAQPSQQPQSPAQQQSQSLSQDQTGQQPTSTHADTWLNQPREQGTPQQAAPRIQPQSQPQSPSPAQVQPSPQAQQPAPRTSQDPVIQMLATRAASDSELKALMQIVASKKADQTQLRRFQTHIDELNAIINARNTPSTVSQSRPSSSQSLTQQPGPSPSIRPQTNVPASTPVNNPPKPHVHPRLTSLASSSTPYQPSPLQHSFVHSPAKAEPKAMVFEFLTAPAHSTHFSHVATGDRYLFPPNTILEYTAGGTTVIASFLAIKMVDTNEAFVDLATGKQGAGRGKYNKKQENDKAPEGGNADGRKLCAGEVSQVPGTPDAQENGRNGPGGGSATNAKNSSVQEFYQPVTIKLCSPYPRVLDPLARVVHPPEEVRKYMDDIMNRFPRAGAPDVHLALRLPKEGSNLAKEMERLSQAGPSMTKNEVNSSKSSRRKSSTTRTKSKPADEAPPTQHKARESFEPTTATGPPCGIQAEDDELRSIYGPPSFLMPLG